MTIPDFRGAALENAASSRSFKKDLRNPWLLVHLPTIDIVIAYYNEPISNVRTMISRLQTELTWARVHVVVYHLGIAGYGDTGTERGGRGLAERDVQDLKEVVERFRKDWGADRVVPRRNIGRDMGVYLHHMQVRSKHSVPVLADLLVKQCGRVGFIGAPDYILARWTHRLRKGLCVC